MGRTWCYREKLQATTCLQVYISKNIQCRCLSSLFPSDLIWMMPVGTTNPTCAGWDGVRARWVCLGPWGRSQSLQSLPTTSILAGGDQGGHLPNAPGQNEVGQLRCLLWPLRKSDLGCIKSNFSAPPKSIPAHSASGFEGKKLVLKAAMQALGQAPGAQHPIVPHL